MGYQNVVIRFKDMTVLVDAGSSPCAQPRSGYCTRENDEMPGKKEGNETTISKTARGQQQQPHFQDCGAPRVRIGYRKLLTSRSRITAASIGRTDFLRMWGAVGDGLAEPEVAVFITGLVGCC